MLCPYCRTEQEQKKICSYCQADMTATRPEIKQIVSQEESYQPQPVLATYHTYDLLRMLQYIRKQRTDNYKQMQMVRKAPAEVSVPDDIIKYAQQEYSKDTTQMRIIEGILIDRLGYKPKRVDNKLLSVLKAKMDNA